VTKAVLVDEMREKLEAAFPTALFSFAQPIQTRVDELISGIRASLAVKIYGEDLRTLSGLAEQVKDVLAAVPGATDVPVETLTGKPMLTLQMDRGRPPASG
jgi:cobalt-zinc-cadmium resistance protein CzcA